MNSELKQIKNVLSFLSNTVGDLNTSSSPVTLSPKNISDDNRRLIYLLSIDGHPYYIKIAPKDGELDRKILAEMDITNANLGQYVYEARIYEELNKQMRNTNNSDYITKIYGWGMVSLEDNPTYFNINFNSKQYNLNILDDDKLDAFDADYYSYMITESDSNYNTLESLIDIGKINNIDKVYENGVKLLQSCFNKCGFVHWDFHHGNILCNPDTNQVKLFDFDLSEIDYVNNEGIKTRSVSWKDDVFESYINRLEQLTKIYQKDNMLKKKDTPMTKSYIAKYAGKCYDYYRFMSENSPFAKISMDDCLDNILSKLHKTFGDTAGIKELFMGPTYGPYEDFTDLLSNSVLKYKDKC